ncbi:hypothetical protein V2O64_21535 [Verrucomicrobiaceae bacterium 227]
MNILPEWPTNKYCSAKNNEMQHNHISLLILPLLLLGSCKKNQEHYVSEGDKTQTNTAPNKQIEEINLNPLIKEITDKTKVVANELNKIHLIVNYDDSGDIWLTGVASNSHQRMTTMDELSKQLSMIQPKGKAVISHVYDGAVGLLAPSPPRNTKLEERINDQLIKHGFNKPAQ